MTDALGPIIDERRTGLAGAARSSVLARWFDRHAASWALRALGAIRPRLALPVEPRHIGLFVINAIGDTLLVSAIAMDLRLAFPASRITLVVSDTNAGVASLIPGIDDIIALPLFRPHRAIPMMRGTGFDLLIDFTQWARITALYSALSGVPSIGFRTKGEFRHYAYDRAVTHSAARHELDNFRALSAAIGVVSTTCQPRVVIPPEARASLRGQLPHERYIVFHPWAGGENGWRREWPTSRWVALAARIAEEGYTILVTGSPLDRPAAEALVAAATSRGVAISQVAGRFNLPATAALIEGAAAVVSVNTGLMHLAACLDAPLVALHGPTNPVRWGPLGAQSVVILPSQGPNAYLNLGYEYPKGVIDCMPFISVDAVWTALLGLLTDDAICDAADELPRETACARNRLTADE